MHPGRAIDCQAASMQDIVDSWLHRATATGTRPHSIFSKLCDQQCRATKLEPLAVMLYDPRRTCPQTGRAGWMQREMPETMPIPLLSKAHLALPELSTAGHLLTRNGVTGRLLIFDIGASLFDGRPGGPNPGPSGWGSSGKWLVDAYKARGLEFAHLYAWDAHSHEREYRKAGVADDQQARITFYRGKVLGASGPAPSNPLAVLRAECRLEDFCVLKVDFDSEDAEYEVVEAVLADAATRALVDEMFFEHGYRIGQERTSRLQAPLGAPQPRRACTRLGMSESC